MLPPFKKDSSLIALISFLIVNETGYNECLYISFFINVCLWLYYCSYFYYTMYPFISKKKSRGHCSDKVKACCKLNVTFWGFFLAPGCDPETQAKRTKRPNLKISLPSPENYDVSLSNLFHSYDIHQTVRMM